MRLQRHFEASAAHAELGDQCGGGVAERLGGALPRAAQRTGGGAPLPARGFYFVVEFQ